MIDKYIYIYIRSSITLTCIRLYVLRQSQALPLEEENGNKKPHDITSSHISEVGVTYLLLALQCFLPQSHLSQ